MPVLTDGSTGLRFAACTRLMSDRLVYLEDGLPGLPEDLMLARDRGEVLFLTGAGVSTPPPSSLPNFRGLVIDIYRLLDARLATAMDRYVQAVRDKDPLPVDWREFADELDAKQKTELKRFAGAEYDVALGMLERRTAASGDAVRGMRAAAAKVLNAAEEPNALHTSLNVLGRRFGAPFIATTNFDMLHERAAGQRLRPRSFGLGGLPRPSRRADFHGFFHIHGRIDPTADATPDIVLTDQDFGDAYLRRRYATDFIYDAVRIFHLVIVGYSLNDAPFRYLLNAVAGDSLHFPDLKARYAIVSCRDGDPTVAEEWVARSIQPVCYDDADHHHQLQLLMAAWAQSAPVPGSNAWPKARLQRICRSALPEASESERSVFGYLIRRGTGAERGALAAHLGRIGADPSWLDEANRIVRELGRGE